MTWGKMLCIYICLFLSNNIWINFQ